MPITRRWHCWYHGLAAVSAVTGNGQVEVETEMKKLLVWYGSLGRKWRRLIQLGGGALAVLAAVLVFLLATSPKKVEVRFGTIVWDPIDGTIWEDNTQTALVDAKEAGNYRIEYVTRYSPEHQAELEKQAQASAEELRKAQEAQGLEPIQAAIPKEQMESLRALQQNIQTMGQDIVTGMKMANQISETKTMLVNLRNQVASTPLPAELEPLRQKGLTIFDKYIAACDLYLKAIATSDLSYLDQANQLIQEASELAQSLIPS